MAFIHYSLILLLISILGAQASSTNPSFAYCEDSKGNFTANSTYQHNLSNAFSALETTGDENYGFYTSSHGQNPDYKARFVGLCRGEARLNTFRACLDDSWCLLNHACSNRSLTGSMESRPRVSSWNNQTLWSSNNHSDTEAFYRDVATLLYLSRVNYMDFVLVTPSYNFRRFHRHYGGSQYTTVYPHLDKENNLYMSNTITSTVGLLVTSAALILIISVGVYSRVKKYNYKKAEDDTLSEKRQVQEIIGCTKFDFSTIKAATNNFSERNKIGESIFGAVYKGKLRNGQYIAIKSLDGVRQDFFLNEVRFGAEARHRNLVRLLGFCSKGDKKFFVYEYLPMRLDRFLFDPREYGLTFLNWDRRYKIIKGIASALLYLHEDSGMAITHGDISAGKVLLDEDLNPKISSFGGAKYFGVEQSNRVSTTRVLGTVGYIAPECFMGGMVTVMSDVYSFGVLLLEIVSGQRCGSSLKEHGESFISYVWKNWREGTTLNLIDPRILRDGMDEDQIGRCLHIGLLCVQQRSRARPTMSSIVFMLNSDTPSLPILSESHDFAAESSDHDSSEGFVSASETSMSPVSETTSLFCPDEAELDREPIRPHNGVLARLHYLHFRVIAFVEESFSNLIR